MEVQTFKPELKAYLRSAQSIVHLAHADRGTSIKPVRPPENPDSQKIGSNSRLTVPTCQQQRQVISRRVTRLKAPHGIAHGIDLRLQAGFGGRPAEFLGQSVAAIHGLAVARFGHAIGEQAQQIAWLQLGVAGCKREIASGAKRWAGNGFRINF